MLDIFFSEVFGPKGKEKYYSLTKESLDEDIFFSFESPNGSEGTIGRASDTSVSSLSITTGKIICPYDYRQNYKIYI